MPGWTLLNTHPTLGRIFQRPLDGFEKPLYLLHCLDGYADILYHYEIHLTSPSDTHLFSESNIIKAWLSTKRRYPLAGALIRGADNTPLQLGVTPGPEIDHGPGMALIPEPYFVVQEHDLTSLRPGEVTFGSVTSAEEAQKQAATVFGSKQSIISDNLQAQLHVLCETEAEDSKPDVRHLIIQFGHCIVDGMSARTFIRCLLDTLARGGVEPVQLPLEERLAMAVSLVDVQPSHLRSLSPAIRRWRKAVGVLISQQRMAKWKGGHTLPRRRTPLSSSAAPGIASTSLNHTQTTTVLANCRQHGITFSSAYSVLAQVAMTRVLYRRYLRGEISEAEWEYRRQQPHHSGGHALNLRPYLDKAWFENGGAGEFIVSLCSYFLHQPSMAIGGTCHRHVMSDGAPQFSDLLTFDRFVHRARLVRKQVTAFVNHPLFMEIVYAAYRGVTLYSMHLLVLRSRCHVEATDRHEISVGSNPEEDVSYVMANKTRPVLAHGGSSTGNLDLILPMQYPIPPIHPLSPYSSIPHPSKAGYIQGGSHLSLDPEADMAPKIVIKHWMAHINVGPEDLMFGATTAGGRLSMCAHFDGAVFEDAVVNEWLNEVKGAVLWYLGQSKIENGLVAQK